MKKCSWPRMMFLTGGECDCSIQAFVEILGCFQSHFLPLFAAAENDQGLIVEGEASHATGGHLVAAGVVAAGGDMAHARRCHSLGFTVDFAGCVGSSGSSSVLYSWSVTESVSLLSFRPLRSIPGLCLSGLFSGKFPDFRLSKETQLKRLK